jgi:hypothetical protein
MKKTPTFRENLAAAIAGCLFISAPVILAGLGIVKG